MAARFGSAFWEKQMETASFFMKALGAIYLIREHVVEFRAVSVPAHASTPPLPPHLPLLPAQCVGPSMLPTLNSRGDILLVDQTAPTFDRIAVGDVVIARSVQNPRHTVCKRVLGLQGDEVDVHPPNRPGSTHKIKVRAPTAQRYVQFSSF
jgi:hypothetical protein